VPLGTSLSYDDTTFREVCAWCLAALLALATLICYPARAEIPSALVNPPKHVSPELMPYVFRFEDALRGRGFAIAEQEDRDNLDLVLTLTSSAMSITITAELLYDGRGLVKVPTKNRTFSKQGAIAGTAQVAAGRFSQALASYTARNRWPASAPPQSAESRPANNAPSPPSAKFLGTGTAFAVAPSKWFLTAYHVVDEAGTVVLQCGELDPVAAKVSKIDPANDVALLQAEIRPAAALTLAPDNSATVGESVFTMGFPTPGMLGLEPKYTEGVISSLTGLLNYSNLMQVTVPIQPGNSGGPLVDRSGNVVGIMTSSAAVRKFLSTTGTLPQNVNWAVRSEYARPLLVGIPQVPHGDASREQAIKAVSDSICLVQTYE